MTTCCESSRMEVQEVNSRCDEQRICQAICRVAGLAKYFPAVGRDKKLSSPDVMRADWWEALRFWFDASFMSGNRSYEQSMKYLECALEALAECFGDGDRAINKVIKAAQAGCFDWRHNNEIPLFRVLEQKGVRNHQDRRMVAGSLTMIAKLPNLNIVEWAIQQIEDGDLQGAHKKLDRIYNVGDKKAALFLQEVVDVYELRLYCKGHEEFLQPIDVHVERLCQRLGIAGQDMSHKQIKRAIVQSCRRCKVDFIAFNHAAWYVGKYALDVVVKLLYEQRE